MYHRAQQREKKLILQRVARQIMQLSSTLHGDHINLTNSPTAVITANYDIFVC